MSLNGENRNMSYYSRSSFNHKFLTEISHKEILVTYKLSLRPATFNVFSVSSRFIDRKSLEEQKRLRQNDKYMRARFHYYY